MSVETKNNGDLFDCKNNGQHCHEISNKDDGSNGGVDVNDAFTYGRLIKIIN